MVSVGISDDDLTRLNDHEIKTLHEPVISKNWRGADHRSGKERVKGSEKNPTRWETFYQHWEEKLLSPLVTGYF